MITFHILAIETALFIKSIIFALELFLILSDSLYFLVIEYLFRLKINLYT